MYAIVLLVVVATLSLLITRVATIALTVTGMARPSARFQARSALTGVGFTTDESEAVVSHPARRRIIMALMLLGNVGMATALAGILGGFLRTNDFMDGLLKVLLLVGGLALVYAASLSSRVDRILSRAMGRFLARFTDLDVRDYASLLHVAGEYQVKEMLAKPDSWLVERSLGELRLRDEGIIVLGVVRRDGSYVGIPSKDTCIAPGETMILYGRNTAFLRLAGRDPTPSGERAHSEAMLEQRQVVRQEEGETAGRPDGTRRQS